MPTARILSVESHLVDLSGFRACKVICRGLGPSAHLGAVRRLQSPVLLTQQPHAVGWYV